MTPETIMSMGRQAIEITVMVSAPLLLAALIIGLMVSIFQAATQINETTLSFIPKFMGIMATLVIIAMSMIIIIASFLLQGLTTAWLLIILLGMAAGLSYIPITIVEIKRKKVTR